MKRTNAILSLILALILLSALPALFAGCSSQGEQSKTPAASQTQSGPSAASSAQSAETKPTEQTTEPTEQTAKPTEQTGEPSESSEPTAEPTAPTEEPTEPATEPDDRIDMEAFLTELVEKHPDGSPIDLCQAMLESPYFALFSMQNVDFYCPGLDDVSFLKRSKDAFGVFDHTEGSLVIVVKPNDETDVDALMNTFKESLQPGWVYGYEDPDALLTKEIGGMIFLASYHSDMRPITVVAEKARDYVQMFHDYFAEHPDDSCLDAAQFFARHQKFANMFSESVTEGRLRGFGEFDERSEIYGFADGAKFEPTMEPNTFICYIFALKDGVDVDSFVSTLRSNANLAWNVCVAANTIITETDGRRVLFMMCSETPVQG